MARTKEKEKTKFVLFEAQTKKFGCLTKRSKKVQPSVAKWASKQRSKQASKDKQEQHEQKKRIKKKRATWKAFKSNKRRICLKEEVDIEH